MAGFLGMLRSLEEDVLPLTAIAARANRYVCREVEDSGQYVTALLARLAPGGRKLSYVSLGHPPPLLWRDGVVTELPRAAGLPAGFLADGTYAARDVDLRPGDRVVFYTDGLLEARSKAGAFFGLDGLGAAFAAAVPAPPADVLEAVFAACQAHAGEQAPGDDQTAIVVEVL
jgi:serine phosphatase RsbU (regulator of sigma subunit)